MTFSAASLNPLENRNSNDGGRGQVADQEGQDINKPGRNPELSAVGQFIMDNVATQFPADKEDDQQTAEEHQHVGRNEVKEIEDILAKEFPTAQNTLRQ